MVGLKVRCISVNPYLKELPGGGFVEGQFNREMISLTLNRVYEVLEEDGDYYRIIDNTDEDYLYPKKMFELVM